MTETTLYQRSKTGKIKFITLWTEGAFLCTKWGTIGSKVQESRKECEPKNPGRSNATTAEEQAVAEMIAKIKKKKDGGYVEDQRGIREDAVEQIVLSKIPKEFCPSKPIPQKNMSKALLEHENTYGQRKRDGHCVILVKTEVGEPMVYSRGMEDITGYMMIIPEVYSSFPKLKNGDMVLTEFCFVKEKTGRDNTREVAKIIRKKDPQEAMERYLEAKETGRFEIAPFDMMFSEGHFIGHLTYTERLTLLESRSLDNIPEIIPNWKEMEETAKTEGWEGFILRNDRDSQIRYSLNGKADRAGCYKYVFTHTDDFIVKSAEKGKAGKQTGLYAQFNLAQLTADGLLDCGNCGPGKLTHDRLRELTQEIDSGELQFPFVIEVEYRDRQPDSGKLTFPQFCRVRYDKEPEECTIDWQPEE